jgi:hypothetical protein
MPVKVSGGQTHREQETTYQVETVAFRSNEPQRFLDTALESSNELRNDAP